MFGSSRNLWYSEKNAEWMTLTYDEKNRLLYLSQKKTLDMFEARGAISKAQHDESLHYLNERMAAAF